MTEHLIANTGPLIALASIDRLDMLRSLFASVCVPQAVHDEILQGGTSHIGLRTYRQADWITVAQGVPLDLLLSTVLDQGEASVIILARLHSVDTVLIGERKARKIARTIYGLRVIGIARVLVEAKRHGVLNSVATALRAICEHGYWIHDEIVRYALKEAGETEVL